MPISLPFALSQFLSCCEEVIMYFSKDSFQVFGFYSVFILACLKYISDNTNMHPLQGSKMFHSWTKASICQIWNVLKMRQSGSEVFQS